MNEPLIRDIPTIKKALEDVNNFRTFKCVLPVLRPFLNILGVKTENLDEALTNTDELARQAEELASIPDRFNMVFAPLGWIIYDLMNMNVAKAAVEKAEAGDVAGAENDLVEYYSVENVRWKLQKMKAIKAFQPRISLAQKALIDYEEGRYHACIPVVLALLDGFVNELHDTQKGFFAEDVDLTAWDSIAAHRRGLNALADIFKKKRSKTRTEPIRIPYRHGIMHGRDLGYDNKMVAAKTWAALFATRDWAERAEKGLLTAPPEEPKMTWKELFHKLRKSVADKECLDQWTPREIPINQDTPLTGEPDVFEDGTPEKRLAEYLTYWRAKNYGYMARYLHPKFGPPAKEASARIREVFASKTLKSFAFTEITDQAAAASEIQTMLVFEEYEQDVEKSVRFRLVNVDSEGNAEVRGIPNSDWRLVYWEVY